MEQPQQSIDQHPGVTRRQVLTAAGLAGVAAALSPLLTACGSPRSASANPNLFEQPEIGFAMGDSLFFTPDSEAPDKQQMTPEEIGKRLDLIKKLGATAICVDFDGNLTQSQGIGTYDWSFSDNIMKAASERGLDVLATVTYWPTEGQVAAARAIDPNSYTGMPANPVAFAKFAGLVAARYKNLGLNRFKIWNEENTAIGGANPALYAQLYALSAKAIKKANEKASVSLGALAYTNTSNGAIPPVQFLDDVLSKLGKDINLVDAVAVNAYTAPATPDQPENWDLFTAIEGPIPPLQPGQAPPPTIHDIMIKHRIGSLPVLMTETGAPTDGTGVEATLQNQQFNDYGSVPGSYVDEQMQQADIRDALTYKFHSAHVTQRYVFTAFKGQGNSPLENFGVVDEDGTTITPAGYTFQGIARNFVK